VYSQGPNDTLAQDMTRLAGGVVEPDEIEKLLFALQRAGHLTRKEMISLQGQVFARSQVVTFYPFGDSSHVALH